MRDMEMNRVVDELGRVVLPAEARRALDVGRGDTVSLFMNSDGHSITIKKSGPSCCCCQSDTELRALPNGKYICSRCLAQVKL